MNVPAKIALALAIFFSAGAKILISSKQPIVGDVVEQHLQDLFSRNGYAVERSEPGTDPFFISAVAGSCAMKVYLVAPQGWHRFLISELKSPSDRSFFMFDGIQYEEQPVWATWLGHQWWRIGFFFGWRPSIKPVLGITQSIGCVGRFIPWQEIARVPI